MKIYLLLRYICLLLQHNIRFVTVYFVLMLLKIAFVTAHMLKVYFLTKLFPYWWFCFLCSFLLQPALLIALFCTKDNADVQPSNGNSVKHPANEASSGLLGSKKSSLVDALLQFVERSDDLINRYGLEGLLGWIVMSVLLLTETVRFCSLYIGVLYIITNL